jgi:hypothetical protein
MPAARNRSALPLTAVSVADQALRIATAASAFSFVPAIFQRRAFW